MGLDPETILTHEFEEIEHTYTERDTALYALGVGLGHDPLDNDQLRFLYEDGMAALPTMAVVLAYPGFWLQEPWTGVDWVKVLHGEQSIRIHKPLPTAATVRARTRVTEVVDKGAAKGALIYTERDVYDCASGDLLCTLGASAFARGDGGFAAAPGPGHPVHHVPTRPPDLVRDSPTLPQAALIYRLSGDLNPLHAVPAVARAGGLRRAHPARPRDPRRRRACHPRGVLRLRPGAPAEHGLALLRPRLSGRDHSHRDVARRWRRLLSLSGGRARCRGPRQRPRRGGGLMKECASRASRGGGE